MSKKNAKLKVELKIEFILKESFNFKLSTTGEKITLLDQAWRINFCNFSRSWHFTSLFRFVELESQHFSKQEFILRWMISRKSNKMKINRS